MTLPEFRLPQGHLASTVLGSSRHVYSSVFSSPYYDRYAEAQSTAVVHLYRPDNGPTDLALAYQADEISSRHAISEYAIEPDVVGLVQSIVEADQSSTILTILTQVRRQVYEFKRLKGGQHSLENQSYLLEGHIRGALLAHLSAEQAATRLPPRTARHEVSAAADPIEVLTKRLKAFKSLKPNWNGYGGIAPTEAAIEECVRFVRQLGPLMVLPTPMVSGQGEVGLLWERHGTTVEVGFRGDERYGYLVELPDGRVEESEEIPLNHLPPLLDEGLATVRQA